MSSRAQSHNPSNLRNVSVVIPTLGGETLEKSIDHLNNGSLVPAEILICIPENIELTSSNLTHCNVRVVRCPERGQVAQRAFGFNKAINPLVLQVDDDIYLRPECLQNLVELLGQYADISVGPKLYDEKTGEYKSYLIPKETSLNMSEKFLFWIINGSK